MTGPGQEDRGRASVPRQQRVKKPLVLRGERRVIDEHQPDGPAFRIRHGLASGLGQIARTDGIIPLLTQLGAQEGTRPLLRHDQQHPRWMADD